MSESRSPYLQILKTTSLFGGVQFFNIIISIIRTKFIAIFIGPAGMGIATLLNSTINIVSGITSLGIETSAVKHISGSYKNDDLNTVSANVTIVKKLVLFTGILGALLTLFLSGWLSQLTFGHSEHTFSFVFLSITLLFKQLSTGKLVVLQGLRKMRLLAKTNFYGNLFGLLFSIPLYYYYRIDAIVPTIIIASLSSLFFSFYYSKKIEIVKEDVSNDQLVTEGKHIIRLGIMLTLSGFLTLLSTYLIQIYVGKIGGIEEVGFYNAGFTLLNSYVGIIFAVMATDYFPRLAAICDENEKVRISVIQQSFISILIITPIIILFLIFIPLIIKILYTPKFISITSMVSFGILGMLLRAVSWSMGYVIIAKGDSKIFVKTAVGFNVLLLIMNILGYFFYGLEGLGFSFLVYNLIHFFVIKIIVKRRYGFYFDNDFYKIYLICIVICLMTFLFSYIEFSILKYGLMSLMGLVSLLFVLHQVNKKIQLKGIFNSVINRKND
ncbi:oligosaccharide flippase family protein [Flavobacterium sp. WC2509]|uniref:oligosaccharide flippase family protein n=1 Tax=Flavobacterium sp. WC2509 TaxID=3461406 RepID=UPI0040442648